MNIIIFFNENQLTKSMCKHLHFRECKQTIRLSVSKTRGISPARKSRSDAGFALLSLLKRLLRRYAPRNARSAFLTVFSITQPDQCLWFFRPIYFPEKKMLPVDVNLNGKVNRKGDRLLFYIINRKGNRKGDRLLFTLKSHSLIF
jgi:hypothetical protein